MVNYLTMKQVNIAEAKAHFSECIAAAEKGDEVIICRHNQPVAKIIPFQSAEAPKGRGSMRGALTGVLTGDWDGVESLFTEAELDALGSNLSRE